MNSLLQNILSRAGKATGQYRNCFDILKMNTGTDKWIDLENRVDEWQEVDEEKDVLETSMVNELFNAKTTEVEN